MYLFIMGCKWSATKYASLLKCFCINWTNVWQEYMIFTSLQHHHCQIELALMQDTINSQIWGGVD